MSKTKIVEELRRRMAKNATLEDPITYELVDPRDAWFIRKNVSPNGKIYHVYSRGTIESLLQTGKSPITRNPFRKDNVRRAFDNARLPITQNVMTALKATFEKDYKNMERVIWRSTPWAMQPPSAESIRDITLLVRTAIATPGFDPNLVLQNGKTLLFVAVVCYDRAIVKLLLDAGADVNRMVDRTTPLHYCIKNISNNKHSLQILKLLLSRGANPNAEETFLNETPLLRLLKKDYVWNPNYTNNKIADYARELIAAGARVGPFYVNEAVYENDFDTVKVLIAAGGSVNDVDPESNTISKNRSPLQIALDDAIRKTKWALGINQEKELPEKFPLQVALERSSEPREIKNHVKIARILIRHGAVRKGKTRETDLESERMLNAIRKLKRLDTRAS